MLKIINGNKIPSNRIEILKEETMTAKLSKKAEEKFKEEMAKDKKIAGKQIDKSKLEAEGTCEIITEKAEEEICGVKT
jgi:hypothetical protein